MRKGWVLVRAYPIPALAIVGLATGAGLHWLFGLPEAARWVWYATLVGGGAPIVWRTILGMLHGVFASDIVAMLAIVAAVLLDEAFAGAVVVLMQSGGEAIEAYGLRRATFSLRALLERAPRIARRKVAGRLEEVDVREVAIGDTLIVRSGDFVPVDGTILAGSAQIDESALTGEPLARTKKEGDRVLSGAIDVDGAFEMRADKKSEESQYAKIVALVEKAQEQKAPIQRLADRYAVLFTPLTLLMCGIGFWITRDATTILAVLVVATPCPLILATPLAVICGINRAADAGIIVKGGAPIEQVASTQAALFDKTGTITFGTPFVEEILPFNGEPAEELLRHAAMVEQYSSHSIAKAIVAKAKETGASLSLPQEVREFPGRGIEGTVGGDRYVIGSWPFLQERLGKDWGREYEEAFDRFRREEKVAIAVAKNGRLIGFLVLSDRVRAGAREVIARLRAMGVKEIAMLTGDSRANAEVIARQAGIERVEAQLLPEQKVAIVHEVGQRLNPVLMVGDGINDAPALATATVGIAMGASGTAISAEAADIVLLVDDLGKVAEAMEIGQRMLQIAKQSIGIGIGLSFCLMGVAAFGKIPPPVGAMLQEIIDVAVILNALRVK